MNTRDLTLAVVFAGLYAVLVIVLAPISFGPIQLRVADCLIPLAIVFGWPVVIGVSLGCFVGNAYFWLGAYDVFLGPIANLVSALLIYLLRRHALVACVLGSFPLGLIVGGYLWVFFPPPEIFGPGLPAWVAMVISITMSSLVALVLIGYPLAKSLGKLNIVSAQFKNP